jgi:transcriptional regulator with PAS, ATPase and Fis domain
MPHRMMCWIGNNDLHGAAGNENPGPIKATIEEKKGEIGELILLSNFSDEDTRRYIEWLRPFSEIRIKLEYCKISSPVDYEGIYRVTDRLLEKYSSDSQPVSVLLSPGTPAMQTVWLFITQTRYPQVELLAASKEQGVVKVRLPFSISAELTPLSDQRLTQLALTSPPDTAQFSDIFSISPVMEELKQKAAILAQRSLPVLLLGETGTGKELFARAIHNSSQRADKPWRVVNCGAIPHDLIDSKLFGHKRGSFTGAERDQPGLFEEADGGTLFLDEIGELPLAAQVRLLRVLQEGAVTRVGENNEHKVDVRIIAATHRNLLDMVTEGTFREDLFYRISIGVLNIPALKQREGDLGYLADRLLARITQQEGIQEKRLSPEAKNVILKHGWPGNVRELNNTLLRATIWQTSSVLRAEDLQQAMIHQDKTSSNSDILNREINDGFNIQDLLDQVEAHYVELAWESTHQKKMASEMLGYKNWQSFDKRLRRFGIISDQRKS